MYWVVGLYWIHLWTQSLDWLSKLQISLFVMHILWTFRASVCNIWMLIVELSEKSESNFWILILLQCVSFLAQSVFATLIASIAFLPKSYILAGIPSLVTNFETMQSRFLHYCGSKSATFCFFIKSIFWSSCWLHPLCLHLGNHISSKHIHCLFSVECQCLYHPSLNVHDFQFCRSIFLLL